MSAALQVLDGGVGTTVQDLGRRGRRHWGVALAGALDPWWARAAGARQPLPGWCSVTLQPGDALRLGAVQGLAYLAVAGGLDVPLVLGSRATHERTAMGGLQGRALRAGDRLPCAAADADPGVERRADPLPDDDGPIRVLWGPQDDHFTPAARALFVQADWRLTPERDRMGMRLVGPALEHLTPAHADIVSDGVVPARLSGRGAAVRRQPDQRRAARRARRRPVGGAGGR